MTAPSKMNGLYVGLFGLVVVAVGLPAVVAVAVRPSLNPFPWLLGTSTAISIGVLGRRHLGVAAIVIASVLARAEVLLHPHPVLGGVLLGAVAGLAALSSRIGIHNQLRITPLMLCVLIANPPGRDGRQAPSRDRSRGSLPEDGEPLEPVRGKMSGAQYDWGRLQPRVPI